MRNFILGILATLFVITLGFVIYQSVKSETKPEKETKPSPAITNIVSPTTALVGGDSDKYGCKGSAGYSWCEAKNKCLRAWEEPCQQENDNELIRQALFNKNNWKENNDITVKISTNDGKYASGTVTSQGSGGYFYAIKINNIWEIVADGNGVILCGYLSKYPDYPNTLIPECWDETKEISVKR